MTYCYRCPVCDMRSESSHRLDLLCGPCLLEGTEARLVRDYRAEAVYVAPVRP